MSENNTFKVNNLTKNTRCYKLKGEQCSHQVFEILNSEFFLDKDLRELYQKFDEELYPENKIRDARNRMLVDCEASYKFLEFLKKENVKISKEFRGVDSASIVKIGSEYYLIFVMDGEL